MEEKRNALPENAQRELAPGEEYKPLLGAERKWAEVTPYSVTLGLLMVVIFSAAAAYLGLRVGQVFEAAIPIAIIAVGLTSALGKEGRSGTERHHPVDRRLLRSCGGGRYIHTSCHLHSWS